MKESILIKWLIRTIKNKFLEVRHRKIKIEIGWMSVISNSKIGLSSHVKDNVLVLNSKLGDFTKLSNNVSINETEISDFSYVSFSTIISKTKIGKFCSIGPDCKIGLGKHPVSKFVSTHPIFFSSAGQNKLTFANKDYFNEFEEITIGNDVWIGSNSLILDGITIGDGAIIGAGSVVTKHVPPYAIVAGIPAKLIRYRFEKQDIDFLMKLQWWNKDKNWLKENFLIFHDIEYFINKMKV